MTFAERLVRDWYAPSLTPLTTALAPIAPLFRVVSAARRGLYRAGALRSDHLPVPVVVIGNITVGGSGKTPLVDRARRGTRCARLAPRTRQPRLWGGKFLATCRDRR